MVEWRRDFQSRHESTAFQAVVVQRAEVIPPPLADRLVRAAGFRNVVAHAYDSLDMLRVHAAVQEGPADLRAFIASLRDRVPSS